MTEMRILVAEDSLAQQALFRSVLDAIDDAEVTYERDGLQAYRAVLDDPPDVLIADIMMPGVDGLAMTRLLKHHAAYRALRVIVCSSATDADVPEMARRAGAAAWLPKPFEEDELLEAIRQVTEPGRPRADGPRLQLFG